MINLSIDEAIEKIDKLLFEEYENPAIRVYSFKTHKWGWQCNWNPLDTEIEDYSDYLIHRNGYTSLYNEVASKIYVTYTSNDVLNAFEKEAHDYEIIVNLPSMHRDVPITEYTPKQLEEMNKRWEAVLNEMRANRN